MPTGTGKTVVFCHLVSMASKGLCLILAPTDELCQQPMDKIHFLTSQRPGLEKAESRCLYKDNLYGSDRVIISSVPTQDSGRSYKRYMNFDPNDFSLLIIDEAHYAISPSYMRVVKHYMSNKNCKVVGFTATPIRHDGKAMGSLFEKVSYSYGIAEAIEDGWLVPITRTAVEIDGIDLTSIKTSGREFNKKQLGSMLENKDIVQQTAAAIIDVDKGRKRIIFSAGIRHAKKLCDVLNHYEPGSTKYVYGRMPNRTEVVEDFRKGRIQRLVNAEVLSHGYDDPEVMVVTIASPGRSKPKITQKIGRGTRVLPGILEGCETSEDRKSSIMSSRKPCLEVVDMIGNAGMEKAVDEFDILGGEYTDSEISLARKMSKGRSANITEMLEDARKEISEADKKRNKYKSVSIFDTSQSPRSPTKKNKPPTEKMSRLLRLKGFDPGRLTFNQARYVISAIKSNGWSMPNKRNMPSFARHAMADQLI